MPSLKQTMVIFFMTGVLCLVPGLSILEISHLSVLPIFANISTIITESAKMPLLRANGEVVHTLARSDASRTCGDISPPFTSVQMHSHALSMNVPDLLVARTRLRSTCDLTTKFRSVIVQGNSRACAISGFFVSLDFFWQRAQIGEAHLGHRLFAMLMPG